MATSSRFEKISGELPEKAVVSVCDGVQALSLCDIQIDTQTDISSTWENQKTEEKEKSPIGDGYPMMRNKPGAIHNMSTILVGTPA